MWAPLDLCTLHGTRLKEENWICRRPTMAHPISSCHNRSNCKTDQPHTATDDTSSAFIRRGLVASLLLCWPRYRLQFYPSLNLNLRKIIISTKTTTWTFLRLYRTPPSSCESVFNTKNTIIHLAAVWPEFRFLWERTQSVCICVMRNVNSPLNWILDSQRCTEHECEAGLWNGAKMARVTGEMALTKYWPIW